MTHTALIIDDEADIRELIALSLDRIGLNTHTAANLAEATNLLNEYTFDVCLTDMRLPDGNGVEFVKQALELQPDLPVAVITAHGNMDAAVEAMKNGAFDFVSKPVDIKLLRDLVTQALRTSKDLSPADVDSNANAPQAIEQTAKLDNAADDSDDSILQLRLASSQAKGDIAHNLGNDSTALVVEKGRLNTKAASENSPDTGPTLAALSGRIVAPKDTVQMIGKGKLIGQSEPMQALRVMIAKVARTNAPVWITGESGTGKELIARLIHENSPRKDSPFVAINCGAIPAELMESEMFGHRKGSFTGAHSDHDGLFKRAEGGTLFLDEVAELPLHMQVKLLRAIQERAIRPVGSSEEITTNARILSASHKDLAAEVESGLFRHDLYYRLNVISIKSPSLRYRADDVIDLSRHILKCIALSEGFDTPLALSLDAEKALSCYAFPGNVRELENILERAVALSDGNTIDAQDLNINITATSVHTLKQSTRSAASSAGTGERQAILDMLSQTRWNRKAAAEKLGMSYRQLRYRIKQYGIDEDETGT